MCDKEDYLTGYRVFFENFAATVNPEDQLPVNIAGYTITESELPGEVLYWTTQYLTEKQCPLTLMTPMLRIILDEVRVAAKKTPNEFGYKSDESVYIALRLMQAVTARVNEICLRYLDNSRLDSLPPPPPLAQREMKTVSCATKNSRRVMEDRHVEIGNLEALFGIETTESTSFYAVYDGHAGSAAATYCAAHLHQYLVESAHFTKDLQRAMREAFLRTDTEFVRKSNQERACGGSTAVAVTVRGRKLLAAWAGDSLALLAKRMRLMQLVRPHKPGRQDERDRIEQSGGTVMYWGTWRVNGQLAVSRAIGDAQYKPYVTASPEIVSVDLDGDEDFVVVACDGLWDFVSEDDVALAVYRQLAADPDDLKAVTKRLVLQAKRQGSADNISIIVVFLKDPRDIAVDNSPPMDLGLDNALANAPPFVMETEACKRLDATAVEAEAGECADAEADNGVDNSDSDSEDLGPETAVDADDLEAERLHDPAPPTPPAHTVETNHVDGGLVDNVAESGEDSEDEWNYFKGEGERRAETDEPPRSDTPCQDNSGWETSSVDMNSSPLNPDAPVFVPGTVSGADVLLAESPRKPLPMDDIELPDVAQFQTEAVVRPAELLDLDNCDQLNGHHNVSVNEPGKEHLNGNDNCNMDSLGFGFSVGVETDKTDTGLIQDFERIQKDTTDFCNIQVFQARTETNPFADEGNEELLERLKNKERDPMSMSFYQEKDDDTCERLRSPAVDLNAVQPLPDSDDDDALNGHADDKENVRPETGTIEPDNDALRFDDRADPFAYSASPFQEVVAPVDNFIDFTNNMQQHDSNMEFDSSNSPQEVAQTDTPESHKLLFEQIPEIPDGKSSELGFANEDLLDPSESEVRATTTQDETSQDVDMDSKTDNSPCEETRSELSPDLKESVEEDNAAPLQPLLQLDNTGNEILSESEVHIEDRQAADIDHAIFAAPDDKPLAITPEHDIQENIVVDVHHQPKSHDDDARVETVHTDNIYKDLDAQNDFLGQKTYIQAAASPAATPVPPQRVAAESPLPVDSPLPAEHAVPADAMFLADSPLPAHSPLPTDTTFLADSPVPAERPVASPLPAEVPLPRESPMPVDDDARSPVPESRFGNASPAAVSPVAVVDVPAAASPSPAALEERLSAAPDTSPKPVHSPSGPAPDIVPEEPPRSDLVTDIDIGIPESRAQEICLPVTNEIQSEDGAQPAGTPPPTPAAPLSATPIAADPVPAAAAATAAIAATAAVAAVAGKTKTPASAAKKSPTTPKVDARTPKVDTRTPKASAVAPRTPASAKKPATPAASATKAAPAKTTPARTPASAAKAAAPAARTPTAKAAAPAAKPATEVVTKNTDAHITVKQLTHLLEQRITT
ncbi:uncharacterized protein LOC113237646 [Hyposmocoma kahamanoa]|uniref:uncharacterized protein LOC113237646 n=1 Tax=Hyposmocoma kahamanoa TaxID=1477025 RepID=UPI000E6D9B82|nr:uncharacterized protein LOC113237646 [Hyposmocoma kahamanoa]